MKFDFNPLTGKLDLCGSGSEATDAALYTSTTPTTEAHGGIPAGATFDRVPVTQVIDRILHKPIAPTVTLAAAKYAAGYYETGQTLSDTLTATLTAGTSSITKVELYAAGKLVQTNSTPTSNKVTFATTTTANTKYKVVVCDEGGLSSSSAELSYTFLRPLYWGLPSQVPQSVSGLSKKIAASGTVTIPYPAFDTKRLVFATTGVMTKALNPSLFDITKSFNKTTLQVECLDGAMVTYNVYCSDLNSQIADYPIKFTFTTK